MAAIVEYMIIIIIIIIILPGMEPRQCTTWLSEA